MVIGNGDGSFRCYADRYHFRMVHRHSKYSGKQNSSRTLDVALEMKDAGNWIRRGKTLEFIKARTRG